MTNVQPTKPPYLSNLAEGQKKIAPREYKVRPKWIPFCYDGSNCGHNHF